MVRAHTQRNFYRPLPATLSCQCRVAFEAPCCNGQRNTVLAQVVGIDGFMQSGRNSRCRTLRAVGATGGQGCFRHGLSNNRRWRGNHNRGSVADNLLGFLPCYNRRWRCHRAWPGCQCRRILLSYRGGAQYHLNAGRRRIKPCRKELHHAQQEQCMNQQRQKKRAPHSNRSGT